ncbi:hypothetical protein N480_23900 [Pseudoalteromonas luteoviolacea S2607]|uniref:hypothetical protein n=1 Tax=Pseudoalteromonas luteoviolacea TaxID=43657 RepID=UPI0007B04132|nr:hypothetical protein [Pseudoalteromonas luteoviolacea]KZN33569.1 hypothetical protein N480_23900 [Pseudoalteromonas luteoviolacea S2607]
MEYFYKVQLYVLYTFERSRGENNDYAFFSALCLISFLIMLNVHSAFLLGELLIPSAFKRINDWLYHEAFFHINAIAIYFVPFMYCWARRKKYKGFPDFDQEMMQSSLVKKYGILNFVVYSLASALVFLWLLFSRI